jgi:hypothetical protein
MRKTAVFLIAALTLMSLAAALGAQTPPKKRATPLSDVFKVYEADEWIVSPDGEEELGDANDAGMGELDIYGLIACYDEDYLRVDILTDEGVDEYNETFFAIKLDYTVMAEYFTYFPSTKNLVYEKEKEGKIVERKTLDPESSGDLAGVTDSSDVGDADIYFIIDKARHIGGVKETTYYLTCTSFSGYVTEEDALYIADQTDPVDLQFVF